MVEVYKKCCERTEMSDEETVEPGEVQPPAEVTEQSQPARDWTRPPKWEDVAIDKSVRHRMSKRVSKARVAIARLADTSAPLMMGWLQQTAEGIPKRDLKGEPLRDAKGSIMWLVKPDPLGAFKAMGDVMAYHLPRLKNVEATIEQREGVPLSDLSSQELQQRLLESLGLAEPVGDVIDVTPEPVAVPVGNDLPDWLK